MARFAVPQGRRLRLTSGEGRADGSLRVVYAASIRSCRSCQLREQGQWNGSETHKPRQVSVLLHPLIAGKEPLLWQDWSRRVHRRACIHLLRHQRVEAQLHSAESTTSAPPSAVPVPLSRAERAHTHLSWVQRFTRNARPQTDERITIKLFGVPQPFAAWIGLAGE